MARSIYIYITIYIYIYIHNVAHGLCNTIHSITNTSTFLNIRYVIIAFTVEL